MVHDRRGDGQLRRAEVRARRSPRERPCARTAWPPRAGRPVRLDRGARRDPARRRHARAGRRRGARDPGRRASSGCASTRSRPPSPPTSSAGVRPLALCATGGQHDDRLDRSAARARGRRGRARDVVPRRRRLRRRGGPGRRARAAAAGHRARRLDRLRPAQVALHAAVGRHRPAARFRRAQPLVPLRGQLHLARRGRPPRRRLRHARPAVQPRLRRLQGLDLAAGPRPRGVRPPDRPRRRPRRLPGRAGRGAPGLRADGAAAAVDLLLPPPPGGLGRRRGGARPASTSG